LLIAGRLKKFVSNTKKFVGNTKKNVSNTKKIVSRLFKDSQMPKAINTGKKILLRNPVNSVFKKKFLNTKNSEFLIRKKFFRIRKVKICP